MIMCPVLTGPHAGLATMSTKPKPFSFEFSANCVAGRRVRARERALDGSSVVACGSCGKCAAGGQEGGRGPWR